MLSHNVHIVGLVSCSMRWRSHWITNNNQADVYKMSETFTRWVVVSVEY